MTALKENSSSLQPFILLKIYNPPCSPALKKAQLIHFSGCWLVNWIQVSQLTWPAPHNWAGEPQWAQETSWCQIRIIVFYCLKKIWRQQCTGQDFGHFNFNLDYNILEIIVSALVNFTGKGLLFHKVINGGVFLLKISHGECCISNTLMRLGEDCGY